MITSLLYISKSTAEPAGVLAQVDAILAVSRPRNLSLGVTGALLADAGRFAQVLEGSRENIDILMDYIRRDPRHEDIEVVRVKELSARQFGNWSMAHVPPSRAITESIGGLTRADASDVAGFIDILRHSASALLRL